MKNSRLDFGTDMDLAKHLRVNGWYRYIVLKLPVAGRQFRGISSCKR